MFSLPPDFQSYIAVRGETVNRTNQLERFSTSFLSFPTPSFSVCVFFVSHAQENGTANEISPNLLSGSGKTISSVLFTIPNPILKTASNQPHVPLSSAFCIIIPIPGL